MDVGRQNQKEKNWNLIEKFYRNPLPLLAEEKKGLGREDKVLKGDTLLRLLHGNYPPTIPGNIVGTAVGEVRVQEENSYGFVLKQKDFYKACFIHP